MKIAIITDQHFGARNDSLHFLDYYQKFYDDIFFPALDANGIRHVLILGDTFDRRKYVNFYTYKRAREMFFDRLHARGIKVKMLAGNHDTYFKNTNSVNALNEVVRGYDNVRIFTSATTVRTNGIDILYLPWICDENRKQTMELIRSTSAQIAMGHLELAGFEMYRGSMVSHGDDVHIFDKFDLVMSGHYHHRSSDGHIFYFLLDPFRQSS